MAKAEAGIRFDWGMALLTIWVVVGFYLDLWAHAHGMVDDTFLTPWHAFLYAGAATFGLTLGILATRNLVRGAPWRSALPGPYMVSLIGAIAFLVAGQFDFVWHSMFGFEVSVDALLSPPHLALAACGIVAFSGPIRSVWARPASARVLATARAGRHRAHRHARAVRCLHAVRASGRRPARRDDRRYDGSGAAVPAVRDGRRRHADSIGSRSPTRTSATRNCRRTVDGLPSEPSPMGRRRSS